MIQSLAASAVVVYLIGAVWAESFAAPLTSIRSVTVTDSVGLAWLDARGSPCSERVWAEFR